MQRKNLVEKRLVISSSSYSSCVFVSSGWFQLTGDKMTAGSNTFYIAYQAEPSLLLLDAVTLSHWLLLLLLLPLLLLLVFVSSLFLSIYFNWQLQLTALRSTDKLGFIGRTEHPQSPPTALLMCTRSNWQFLYCSHHQLENQKRPAWQQRKWIEKWINQ